MSLDTVDYAQQFPDINPDLAEKLEAILGSEFLLPPEKILEKYYSDSAYDEPLCPSGLMLPADTEQVSAVLALCNEFAQPVCVQGGMTGLASGATPASGELGLSLERLTGIESIDTDALSITVQAGTPLAQVHERLKGTGLCYGVDYGARQNCQIGGNVATNAGGTQVIRYGMTRAQVLGLEAVLADGTILDSMNQLLKNNAGYDLKQLFIGTEGTLGVVTKLVLRLHPEPNSRCTGIFALADYESCLKLLSLSRSKFGESLHGFEVMWKEYYEVAAEQTGNSPLPHHPSHQVYALVETRGRDPEADLDKFEALTNHSLGHGIALDGIAAATDHIADRIWDIRYAVKTLLKSMRPLANFDIGIPTSEMGNFVSTARKALIELFPEMKPLFFGHIGDGNVHLLATTGEEADVEKIYQMVYPICAQFSGTISAEHGIGKQKKTKLGLSRTPAEIELMKLLKRTLDPKDILNRGRVFDLRGD